jgi:23S rRNA (uracil1939-C5)-methyltransferase
MTSIDDWLTVESLDIEAQGIARRSDGKVVFIEGALPGERVRVQVTRRKAQWEQGQMAERATESPLRVRPGCEHFGLHAGACGGCRMQHLEASAQVAIKQRVLEDNLQHLGQVRPARVLRPIEGPAWGYRYRARLSVRHVPKKGGVLVGFHERKSSYVADMKRCPVLPPHVSAMLVPLRELIGRMAARDRLPQIELAVGERRRGLVTVLVLRHLVPLDAADLAELRAFARHHDIVWWLQPDGPDTAHPLEADAPTLAYDLPEFDVTMPFRPTDFTQVNHQINRVLVDRAVRLLAPTVQDRVIDWFCGMGNFTLALARRAASVHGVEGSRVLVDRAVANAAANGLAGSVTAEVRNLFEVTLADVAAMGPASLWLLDPPREGALALAKALADHAAGGSGASASWLPPRRIVYVSCNPATLARDAGLLVSQAGYRLSLAGVVNMFPHTAHVESMAVFDRP